MSNARFLTPNAPEPHKFFSRRLLIPAASDFLGVVNGALFELCQVHNWEKDGSMSPQEAADFFLALWQQYLLNENEPPDWDTPDNVDGQPAQPWYEQLEDWIIQGFLAITFTPLAALVYQTTVPKIRVAIRTGNIGALFKVLINGVEVWTGDSYGPITDIIEQVFDNPNPGSAATVRVVHNGNGGHGADEVKLEFVRGEAVASMVATILRAEPDGCGIQWSTDNGGSWNTIDLVTCISEVATEKIDQMIADGQLGVPGGQPSPTNPPAPNTCTTYHVVLPANNQWILPFGVGLNDTIQVKNLSGTWSDGTPQWFCTDGATFELSGCFAGGKSHDSADPLNPGAYHMALIMKAGETWYDAPLTAWVQNSGTIPLPVVFQANDGTLTDNTGSISFDVEVCSSTCVYADFTGSQAGWHVNTDGNYSPAPGAWIDGSGFRAINTAYQSTPNTRCVIQPDTDVTYHNPSVTVRFNIVSLGNSNAIAFSTNQGNVNHFFTTTGEQQHTFDFTGDVTSMIINLSLSFNANGGDGYIEEIDICV